MVSGYGGAEEFQYVYSRSFCPFSENGHFAQLNGENLPMPTSMPHGMPVGIFIVMNMGLYLKFLQLRNLSLEVLRNLLI